MFLQRIKDRLLPAAAMFAAFLIIGSTAHIPHTEATEPAPAEIPAAVSAEPLRSVRVSKPAAYASAESTESASEILPVITTESPVVIPPPYLTYYEHGHFKPGENGILITAEGEEVRYSSVIEVSATAYTTERQENKITATGTVAHVGGIAVDPTVIPYGTKMYIISKAGAWAYGYAVAEDCGGGIKGNKVDLFLDTYDECIEFGVRNALIYILEE